MTPKQSCECEKPRTFTNDTLGVMCYECGLPVAHASNYLAVDGEHVCCEHCEADGHAPHTKGCPASSSEPWERINHLYEDCLKAPAPHTAYYQWLEPALKSLLATSQRELIAKIEEGLPKEKSDAPDDEHVILGWNNGFNQALSAVRALLEKHKTL